VSRPPRRWVRPILKSFIASVVIVQSVFWWSVRLPQPDVDLPDLPEPTLTDGVARVGNSSLERRDGYWFFMHRGDAVTLGAEHARLGEFLIHRAEGDMFGDFQRRMPVPLRVLLPPYLMWSYRHMPRSLPPEQQEELWGFSATYADRYPLHPYRRGMYYHALHDITQELVGNPWVDPRVAGACTGFGASGPATDDGHLVLGRNFDFEVFPLFDDQKVVHIFAREGAIPVISVSWMAMSGVVTGMNAEGIWISLNAARTEGKNRRSPPVSLRLRTILEQSRDLDDVRRLVAEQDPLVSDIFLVGDGQTGEAIIIERGKTRVAERGMQDGWVTASNHMLTDVFEGDGQDLGLRQYSSTVSRGIRMAELVSEGGISPARAQEILRDKQGPGGIPLPPGNRNAIDALIATHSVIADATDRIFWVSSAPHTQGPYRAIDLLAELEAAGVDVTEYRATLPPGARAWETPPPVVAPDEPPPPAALPPTDLPADSFLTDGRWERLQRSRDYYLDAEAYLEDERWTRVVDMAARIEDLYPASTDAAWLRAEGFRGAGDDARTQDAYIEFLGRFPARGPRKAEAESWLEDHGALPSIDRPDSL
jgi:isopenicillin-N N-acyltransferase like protein